MTTEFQLIISNTNNEKYPVEATAETGAITLHIDPNEYLTDHRQLGHDLRDYVDQRFRNVEPEFLNYETQRAATEINNDINRWLSDNRSYIAEEIRSELRKNNHIAEGTELSITWTKPSHHYQPEDFTYIWEEDNNEN